MTPARRNGSAIAARVAAGWQVCFGAALLARPSQVAGALSGQADLPARGLIRLLGARSLLQGIVMATIPDPAVLVAGVGVDTLHAVSLVPVVARKKYRRPAAASMALAAASALVELTAARAAQ
jgi:hypothetical protein